MVRNMLDKAAAKRPAPSDVCYAHNFDDPDTPMAITLPAGKACELRDDMDELIEDIRRNISTVFESEEYIERRDNAVRSFREKRQAELSKFEKEAQEQGMVVGRGPSGIIVAPAKDGEVMTPQDYGELPDDEREEIDERRNALQERLNEILRKQHREEKKAQAQVKKLDQEEGKFAVGHLFDELRLDYNGHERVLGHLDRVEQDIVEHIETLKDHDSDESDTPFPMPPHTQSRFDLYRVNVLLTCDPRKGAPVVHEPNPTIDNLTGKVEHRSQMGALVTDYTMIRAGALHRANGGYLLLEVDALLRKPYAWEALKRALKNREIRIESLADQLRFMATVTLEPEPLPLDLKVVLVGTPYMYHLLYEYDDDLPKLFKVKADFAISTRRTAAVVRQYARYVATICEREGLRHFTAEAVSLIIEEAARQTGDQKKLTTQFSHVADLVRQAAYWSGHNGNSHVTAEDVQRAIDEHTRRSSRVEERLIEMVDRDFILLDLKGSKVGQVNGLSVLSTGDYWFGRPGRITARTFPGKSGVTQIDREAKLTGRIHDKGVLILTGFLNDRYGRRRPLALSASLTFEQTYGTIEGDSASSTELYALLSSLADLPLRQDIAVTGSVNQSGEIQAVGGVTQKIEGFFKACSSRGLTGTQGVLIPKANVPTLALSPEVMEAVEAGKFHIYAVSTVDQGMEVLSGEQMGRARKDGSYPRGTINALVQATLNRFAAAVDNKNHDEDEDEDE